jgi:hypothetical protein
MRKPDFFIVGAPKCATTSMYEYLKQHPEIFMPKKKEPHFFGTDIVTPSKYIRDKNEYLSLFAEAQDERRVGEASVWYLYSELAAAEIKAFCPSARIIIMLRNPVDMIYSLHSEFLYHGQEEIEDFGSALEAEEDRKRGLHIPGNCTHYSAKIFFYREVARYTSQIQRYLDVFGRENVHIIILDDLRRRIAQIYREMLRFLDVSPKFQPDFRIINSSKALRNKTLQNFLNNPPRLVHVVAKSLTLPAVRQILISKLLRLNRRHDCRRPMAPELRQRLQEEFTPEVESLSELLCRDLTHWIRR